MLNRVILMGRLTSDIELKTTPSGNNVCSFSIAVERNYAKKGEERKTDFINCVAWRNYADFISRYFHKGSLIAIEGELQTRTYQAKDGTNRHITEVMVSGISFTGERRDNSNSGNSNSGYLPPQQNPQQNPQQMSQQTPTAPSTDDFLEMPLDDDLPF
ncbi:MAG: single-stranded DNA-binding protein [Ruminococcus sp.]